MKLIHKSTIVSSLTILLIVSIVFSARAQEKHWVKPDSLFKGVQASASVQLWSTYSMNEKIQTTAGGPLESVDDRVTNMVRRARFGFKGRPYKKLNYVLTVQYDNLGKDKLIAVRGATNTGTLGILDAYLSWKLTNNDLITITAGYLQPQFSRECITGDLLVNSLDKSASQGYIRNHITGKGYGRVTGFNSGGQTKLNKITLGYNVGLYSNNTTSGNSKLPETTGILWSPLTVERVMVTFGDPEMKNYQTNYDANNFFSQRKGITISGYQSRQGKTDIFSSNSSLGIDLLGNLKNLNFDAEWNWLQRSIEGSTYHAETGHVRAGYNVIIAKKVFLEPTFMIMKFTGDDGFTDTGKDMQYDYGINWYINKKNNKLSLHYIQQSGFGDNGYTDGSTFQKGNFVALAYVLLM